MRILYFLFKIILQYSLRIFYPRIKLINPPKRFFGRTIYVSNHAASFMDPLILGVLQRPIVFFMTRADVFNKYINPFFWAAQMLPIYREQDGLDTKTLNEKIFKKCNSILSFGRNLLIFGEGFTDDIFIRSLKPIKKGAVRIGFGALEAINWEKNIYIAAVGINYGHPNFLGSDLLISNSNRICLNDYKEAYLENPAKVVSEVSKIIEELMQQQLTYIENKSWAPFHEHVCQLRRNGLNPIDTDFTIPLKKRWENSRNLALWMNTQKLDDNQTLIELKKETEDYFKQLKDQKVEEKIIHEFSSKGKLSSSIEFIKLLFFSPLIPLGLIQFYLPYKLTKNFTEKSFKRPVFWSSVKMFLGMVTMGIWNFLLIFIVNYFLLHSGLIALAYFLICPLIGLITYEWFRILKDYKSKQILKKIHLEDLNLQRKNIIAKINSLIPIIENTAI